MWGVEGVNSGPAPWNRMIIDENLAYLGPSNVDRILRQVGLDPLYRWTRSESLAELPSEPTQPNERWYVYLVHLGVENTRY